MVKDHSDSERKPTAATWSTLSNEQGFFYMHHPTDKISHNTAFVISVVEHLLEREITQWVHYEGSNLRPITSRADSIPRSYISLL